MKPMNANLTYQIRVCGQIPEAWNEAFSDLDPVLDHDTCGIITVLSGTFADSAALQGVLNNLYMLGLVLVSVECLNNPRPIDDMESCHAVK